MSRFDEREALREMRRAGHAWGSREATAAILQLGNTITLDEAGDWIIPVLMNRSSALETLGATSQQREAWEKACLDSFIGRLGKVLTVG